MKFPNLPRKGKSISDDVRDIINYLRSSRVVNVVGGRLIQSQNGTTIQIISGKSGNRVSPNLPKPWDLHSITGVGEPNEDGVYSSYKVKVWPGTVNGILPGNLTGVSGLAEFTVPGSGVQVFKAVCNTDGKAVTSLSIAAGTAQPAAQTATLFSLPATFEFCFALFVAGKAYRALGPNAVTATPTRAFIAEKTTTPAFGDLTYEEYYIWVLSS